MSHPSSDTSWFGGYTTRIEKSIATQGGRSKGSTIAVNRPVLLAYSSSLHQTAATMNRHESLEEEEQKEEEEEERSRSEQSPLYQNRLLQDMDSVHCSTVPGTVPDRQRHPGYVRGSVDYNESQLSSLGGTPRWQVPTSYLVGVDDCNPPTHVESRCTPPVTNDNSAAEGRRNSGSTIGTSHQKENNFPSGISTMVDKDPSQRNASDLLSFAHHAEDPAVLRNVTNVRNGTEEQDSAGIPEWDGCNPDHVLRGLKAIPKPELEAIGKREFYKSYTSWSRMTPFQRNKTLSYFRSLPEEMQGLFFIVTVYVPSYARIAN
jgi:hypothetical protein